MSIGSAALVLAVVLVVPCPTVAQSHDVDRMYGRVVTTAGERIEGYLRWDRNETQWADMLDGEKQIPREHDVEAERLDEDLRRRRQQERTLELVGLRITWDEDDGDLRTSSAGIRFGHIASLEVVEERRVALALRSGAEVELLSRSSDLGPSFRGLVVEDSGRGSVELRWRDLDRVDFMPAPPGARSPDAERLHGTLRTQRGVELTGWIAWDMDETLSSDVLDGREGGRDHDVVFASIAAIQRETMSSARVTLRNGEEVILRGTNDVNAGNRGIEVSDPALGRAIVSWEELSSVRFHAPEPAPLHTSFDGGGRLRGTVETRTQGTHSGALRLDNDEEFTWEVLDGRADGVDYDIELGLVRSIERVGSTGARVQLENGRALLLEGSNDVDERNQGIFVHKGGETVLVRWLDMTRVVFER